MAKVKINKRRFIPAILLLLLLIAAIIFAVVKLAGNKPAPSNNTNNTNTVEPGNTVDPGNSSGNTDPGDTTPGNTVDPGGSTDPATDPGTNTDPTPGTDPATDPGTLSPEARSAIEKAASMQDYSIDPSTKMAKDITKVDDNYLLLVNRTHALSSKYVPDDMVTVKHSVTGVGIKGETDQLRKVAADAFEAMVAAAAKENINIKMRTGYRSYAYQRDRLYNPYVKQHGQKEADTFSAKPGQSEHQTGLALDVGGASQNYALSREFGNTKEGKWVAQHCHEYGFIIRYTDGSKNAPGKVTGFISEPWHLRYVGLAPAAAMHESGQLLEEFLGVMY